MSKAKHTPGPWFAHGRYIGTENHKSAIGECRDINGNWSNDAPASENALLISAAPDLLRVAELVVSWLDEEEGAHALCDTARAAIAKATA